MKFLLSIVTLSLVNSNYAQDVKFKIKDVIRSGKKFKLVISDKTQINPHKEKLNEDVIKNLYREKIKLVRFNELGHQPTNDRDIHDEY